MLQHRKSFINVENINNLKFEDDDDQLEESLDEDSNLLKINVNTEISVPNDGDNMLKFIN